MTIDKTDGMQTFHGLALSGIRCPYSFLRVCLALLVYNVSCEYHLGARPSNDYVRDHASAEHMHTPVAIIGPHEACYF